MKAKELRDRGPNWYMVGKVMSILKYQGQCLIQPLDPKLFSLQISLKELKQFKVKPKEGDLFKITFQGGSPKRFEEIDLERESVWQAQGF